MVDGEGKDFAASAKNTTSTTYNLKKVQQYFQAGLKELGQDSLTLNLLGDDDAVTKSITEFLQSQLTSHLDGLKVEVTNIPKQSRITRMQSGDYDLVFTGWGSDFQDAISFLNLFTTESAHNFGKWGNTQYDD
ncbi:ABC transporter substrate-binding protein [Ligilactobacillus equi]|uniref:ABC transporter substrate-binding protein n=1 Tax=Ligilactobacillus equi TaxID=137357 RepID=UPI002ED4911E